MAEITGRQVAVFTVGAFGIIIAVNLVMAWKAVSTFPGVEAPNTFVASQEFDIRREAQERLGWTVAPLHEGGRVKLAITEALADKKIVMVPMGGGGLDVRSMDMNQFLGMYGAKALAEKKE